VNSKDKGKRGELEACRALARIGVTARRAVQYHGLADGGDLVIPGAPRLHTEVKNLARIAVYAAYDQAVRDAGGRRMPWCLLHADRRPWLALLAVDDLFPILKALETARLYGGHSEA